MIKTISNITVMLVLAVMITGCGGGGSSDGRVTGKVTDNWGTAIEGNQVSIVLDGIATVFHPDSLGNFDISVEEGTYNIEFLWFNESEGVEIYFTDSITVTRGQTLNMGNVPLSNSELSLGWSNYRNSDFNSAIMHFDAYLADVRNGHAVTGSNSAYDGLGWCHARVGNYSQAYTNFIQVAIGTANQNTDALVGLGGMFLTIGYDGASYTYGSSIQYLTMAINVSGDYTSFPTHDHISETDLYAGRALAYFLNGDLSKAQSDITTSRATANDQGNFGTLDTLNMLEWIIGNV